MNGKCVEGAVVVAKKQTSGRGQQNSSWESENDKNLLFSVALCPTFLKTGNMFYLSKAISLAILDFLKEFGLEACIKWPNDIYIGDKKICGILIEQKIQAEHIQQSYIGIGININQTLFHAAPNPTSVKLETNRDTDIEEALNKILQHISFRYKMLQQGEMGQVDNEYLNRLYRATGFHAFSNEKETFKAQIVTVKSNGMLVLKTKSGEVRSYSSKQVEFVR
jgi:BirA family biotin operon repressor/biotin-[acetyl-CoA-carboxylase] ligase